MTPKLTRQQAIRLLAESKLPPAAKRKALLRLQVRTEYVPHQGKREMERRKSRMDGNG